MGNVSPLEIIKRKRKLFVYSSLLTLLYSITVIAMWYVFAKFAEAIFVKNRSPFKSKIILLLLMMIFLRSFFQSLRESSVNSLAANIKNNLRQMAFKHLLRANPVFLKERGRGELITKFTIAVEDFGKYVTDYFAQFLLVIIQPILILLVIFPVDPISGVLMLVTAPVIPFMMSLVGDATKKQVHKKWNEFVWMGNFFMDSIRGSLTLKFQGKGLKRIVDLKKVGEQYKLATLNVLKVAFVSSLLLELIATISVAVIAVEVGLRLLYGKIPFIWGFFIILLAPEYYAPFRDLGSKFHSGEEGREGLKGFWEIFDLSPIVDNGLIPPPKIREIRFENVSYTYPGATTPALVGISFRIRAGEKLVIVGKSGAGKSTIFYLMLKYLVPQDGVIKINETPLNVIGIYQWWERLVWVPQDPALFRGTIYENITAGLKDVNRYQLERVKEMANLEFVERLGGFDTFLSNGGRELSGGERQRIIIARAMLSDAPLVLLDEFSASLDPETQLLVEDAMWKLLEEKTAFVIAHRIETILRADKVLLIDNGRIVDFGNHSELIERSKFYRELIGEKA